LLPASSGAAAELPSSGGSAGPGQRWNFREAFRGRELKHHRFPLYLDLNQIDAPDDAMAMVDAQVEAGFGPLLLSDERG
jgi:hypothetical protein